MDPGIINSIGLSLHIVGVILMFIYGLPVGIAHEGDAAGRKWGPPEDEAKREIARWRRRKRLAASRSALRLAVRLQGAADRFFDAPRSAAAMGRPSGPTSSLERHAVRRSGSGHRQRIRR